MVLSFVFLLVWLRGAIHCCFFFFKGWRCKRYGHRTGDKECPFFIKGNQKLEQFRVVSTNTVVSLLVFLILMMHNLASEEKPVR